MIFFVNKPTKFRSFRKHLLYYETNNGYTRNPTARIFRSCVASIYTFSLMKVSEKCNCETDSDNYLTVDILSDVEINNTIKDPIPDN